MAGPNHPQRPRRRPIGRPYRDSEKAARALGDALVELARLRPAIVRRAIAHALARLLAGA